ncbi:hypothetical protein Hdeb2414_s0007g00226781 [Helianthus debilis subsp. tardiflorus]
MWLLLDKMSRNWLEVKEVQLKLLRIQRPTHILIHLFKSTIAILYNITTSPCNNALIFISFQVNQG